MLAIIDVIEQIMSNAAIQKIDPLGQYPLLLAVICALFYRLGIFEGLLALLLHTMIHLAVLHRVHDAKIKEIIKKYLERFADKGGLN